MKTVPAVVVGIDGSNSAIDAALWAVDEAVSREVPLRLVFAVSPEDTDGPTIAESAVHAARAAVETTEAPVKVEAEIVRDRPVHALRAAARGAAMLCVGSVGRTHGGLARVGSTAAALAASVRCPLAIIHSDIAIPDSGCVVAEVDDTPDSDATLRRAVDEAVLRRVPLRVVTTWPSRYTDIHDANAVADGNRLVRRRLDHRLAAWRCRYPGLDIQAVAAPGNIVNYLARHVRTIALVVLSHDRATEITELVGPRTRGARQDIGFDILLCEPETFTAAPEVANTPDSRRSDGSSAWSAT